MRFIQGYIDMRRSARAASQQDIERASVLLNSASQRVPENEFLSTMSAFYRGIVLMQQEKWEEAVGELNSCRDKVPPELQLDSLILSAQIGVAFDNKNYDRFLALAVKMSEGEPENPTAMAQIASAYACKYAVTGDEKFNEEALKNLERARSAPEKHEGFEEYEQRILYRLYTREIITRNEFIERFPDGWKKPREE